MAFPTATVRGMHTRLPVFDCLKEMVSLSQSMSESLRFMRSIALMPVESPNQMIAASRFETSPDSIVSLSLDISSSVNTGIILLDL
jgi:hypothetical protein